MKTLFNFLILCLFPVLLFAGNGDTTQKYEKEKTIKKEFTVNGNATLRVDNRFGNLNVVTWDQNRITIEVHIVTKGNDAENVQQKLDEITVDFTANPNLVTAETIIDKDESWWNKLFGNNSVSMQIDYLIKMPVTGQVDLENDYGNIVLHMLKGRAEISCDYGRISVGRLMADDNELEFDYSTNCHFGYIKGGTIDADYSGFTVEKTQNLNISADYTDSNVEVAEKVVFESDYGSIEIGKANTIRGEGDYLDMRFGEVYKNIEIDVSYGSVDIGKMMGMAENLRIDASYTGIEIGISPEYHFGFTVDLSYASLETPEDFHFSKKIKETGDKYYEGYYGSSGNGNSVQIQSAYGDVEIYFE